ncbi:MAG: formyltetrahydrofolate deformylase [Alphaproteobacteria bacterium]
MTQRYIMTTQSADRTGIVAALTTCLAAHEGFIMELAQFGTPSSERFYSRIAFKMTPETLPVFQADLDKICTQWQLNTQVLPESRKTKTLIMVSKFDHCLRDLLYRHSNGSLNIDITAIVSNHENARGLADNAGLPFHHIPVTKSTKPEAERALRALIKDTGTELTVLARYMQVLSNDMCRDFSGKIINIHHSFLPSFKGAKPYHQAYERGVKVIGATAHYVTADLDEGPIIEQTVQPVNHTKAPEQLVAMGRDLESLTLARAIKLHTEHRAFINGRKTVILP